MSLSLLNATSQKLNNLYEGLKRRDQKFFGKCIEAEVANNHPKAIMYANECAELRKFARIVISSELALEQAILRLQTIDKLGDVFAAITPVVEIVEETKGQLVNTIPSVANQLGEINFMLTNSFAEMGTAKGSGNNSANAGESAKILKEANLAADEKIRERFPTLPEEFETLNNVPFRIPVALAASGGEAELDDKDPITQQVYEYMKASNEQFGILRCADFLQVSPKDVNRALLRLKEEGRISS
ncbi:MAG: hypothetical protein V1915_02885 [Candidatus Bathyarchaeota archaeon]